MINYKSKPLINVILSTFNGEQYLEELLVSLIAQRDVLIRLIYRDDGSSDNSVKLVNRYFSEAIKCEHFPKNIGVTRSYTHLLQHVPNDGLIAFCDQDDIWIYDKCMTAWDKIMNEDYDLYASSVKILGTNVIFPKSSPKISLLNSIFENTTIGSTMVFNQRILESVIHIDNDFILHDELVNLVSTIIGKVFYDENPRVLYRIHANNATGIAPLARDIRTKYLERIVRLNRIKSKADYKITLLQQIVDMRLLNGQFERVQELLNMSRFQRLFANLNDVTFRNVKSENFLVKLLWRIGVF